MSELDPPAHDRARSRLARKLIVDLSIMTVIGIVLAFIGPFGSFEQPLSYRLVSWLGFSYLGYCIYSPMSFVVGRLKETLDLPEVGLWVAAALIATVPMSIAVWSMGYLPNAVPMPSLDQALTMYAYVLVIGGGVTALFYTLEKRGADKVPADPAAVLGDGPPADNLLEEQTKPEPQARFLDRLPPALGSNLIALEMEDHYVRAHTDLGSKLILLRMRDAIAELDGIEGAQVHRSWWVARTAVKGSRREGRNVRLDLSGGLEAPVSRSAAPDLKKQGWF